VFSAVVVDVVNGEQERDGLTAARTGSPVVVKDHLGIVALDALIPIMVLLGILIPVSLVVLLVARPDSIPVLQVVPAIRRPGLVRVVTLALGLCGTDTTRAIDPVPLAPELSLRLGLSTYAAASHLTLASLLIA
jgi:hypothetical protein